MRARASAAAVPRVARISKPSARSRRAMRHAAGLSSSFTLMNAPRRALASAAGSPSSMPLASMRLAERARERLGDAHDLAGRAHLRAEDGVGARELREREDALLHARRAAATATSSTPSSSSVLPAMTMRRDLRERPPGRLRDERHRAARARVHLEDVDLAALHRELHVHQPDDAELEREHARLLLDARARSRAAASAAAGRSSESPEWTPASSMCCITPPMTHALAVGDAVDVDLDRVLQELVDEDRLRPGVARGLDRARRRKRSSSLARVRDHHRAPAEHVARAHEHRDSRCRSAIGERLLGAAARCRCAAA